MIKFTSCNCPHNFAMQGYSDIPPIMSKIRENYTCDIRKYFVGESRYIKDKFYSEFCFKCGRDNVMAR